MDTPSPQLEIGDRLIENPQEIILKGLGLAAKFFDPIRDSLQEATPNYCKINAISAYQFVRSVAWQLQDNGIGVILPKGLSRGQMKNVWGLK